MNFKLNANMTDGDKYFASKFLNGNADLAWDGGDKTGDVSVNLRDETFAEGYNFLNTLDIIHYDNDTIPSRILAMQKYMPRTLVEIEKLSR